MKNSKHYQIRAFFYFYFLSLLIGGKRLKLSLQPDQPNAGGQKSAHLRGASRSISSSCSESASDLTTSTSQLLALEKATKNAEIADILMEITCKVKQRVLAVNQIREVSMKLSDILNKSHIQTINEFERHGESSKNVSLSADVKLQVYICLTELVSNYLIPQVITDSEKTSITTRDEESLNKPHKKSTQSILRTVLRERCDIWVHQLQAENPAEIKAAILTLIGSWFEAKEQFHHAKDHETIWHEAKMCLTNLDHLVKVKSLTVLGNGITSLSSLDRSLAPDILTLVGQYTRSQDPRVRNAAFKALHKIHEQGYKLDVMLYKDFCKALADDYEGVRQIALHLVYIMSCAYPEHLIKLSSHNVNKQLNKSDPSREVRLIDDAFGKICNGVNDVSVQVREKAMRLIGMFSGVSSLSSRSNGVSQMFLDQTLDKKLMSNMRTKKSAHEREAKMVSAGEWSSGKNWADDAPKEELGAEDVKVMSLGACGAFIHGLEDEFMCVRLEAIESLTKLSIENSKLAATALDFLVDMFNDEIELVRLKAIQSLTRIANHITLQVHQLEIIMSALDDFAMIVREKLHFMLQASTIATKDGLQNVIAKLLENIKRYPQDKRSILLTFKSLGRKHSDLTLPLVTQLLEIHPFFDTAEPDVEDPCYLCILVLVFNAAQQSPTIKPLLDHHTKRHFDYLIHTYPHLAKDSIPTQNTSISNAIRQNLIKVEAPITTGLDGGSSTVRFIQQALERVWTSVNGNHSLNLDAKIKILRRAQTDLERLGSIEPAVEDAATFASIYIQAQGKILKCLSCRFWCNSTAIFTQQGEIVQNAIIEVFRLCTLLQGKFIISNLTKDDNKTESIVPTTSQKKIKLNTSQQIRQICVLKLQAMALHLVFLVRASNKSALGPTESFFKEMEKVKRKFWATKEEISEKLGKDVKSDFMQNLIQTFSGIVDGSEARKPGLVARALQPLLLSNPLEPLSMRDISKVAMSKAIVYEPVGGNDTPLKYTAGLVLAVPVDCDLINVRDISLVRVAIRTPDQKTTLVTPKSSDFYEKEESGSYRLRTNALMSHNVWSEALHVEISIVLDFHDAMSSTEIGPVNHSWQSTATNNRSGMEEKESTFRIVNLCEPIKVNVLPKPVRKGI